MKLLILSALVFIGMTASAQESPASDPGGFTQLIVEQLKNAETGASVGLNDGVIGSVTYLPLKTFHWKDADGKDMNLLKINAGAEARKGERLRGLFFPSGNIVGLTNRLLFGSAWAKEHVTGSNLPPIYMGLGPSVPLDYASLRFARWSDLKEWMRLTATVRFGDVVK